MITVRPDTTADHHAVRQLTIDAFEQSEFGHNGEADLIDSIRETQRNISSFVAEEDGVILGHVLFSPATIRDGKTELHGMGLAPMSVLPNCQRKGVGTLLMEKAFEILDQRKNTFTIVAGHPDYYPKFGFESAAKFNVRHGFEGLPQEVFFVRANDPELLTSIQDGRAAYCDAFGPQF